MDESASLISDQPAESGWFPDPTGAPNQRFWDGAKWTEQTRPYPAPTSPTAATEAVEPPNGPKRGRKITLVVLALVALAGLVLAVRGMTPSCPSGSIPTFSDLCAPQSGFNLAGEALYDIRPQFGLPKQANPVFIGIGLLLVLAAATGFIWDRNKSKQQYDQPHTQRSL